jgi:hypothetical protein
MYGEADWKIRLRKEAWLDGYCKNVLGEDFLQADAHLAETVEVVARGPREIE